MKKNLCVVPLVILFCLTIACQDKAAMAELEEFKARAALEEQNNAKLIKVVEKMQEAMNNHNAGAIAQLYAEDATMVYSGEPEPIRGREAIEQNLAGFFRAISDFSVKLNTLISGNHIVFEGVARGTFTGPLPSPEGDISPTGKSVTYRFAFIAKVNTDGLIEEDRTYFDNLSFMQQLGLLVHLPISWQRPE